MRALRMRAGADITKLILLSGELKMPDPARVMTVARNHLVDSQVRPNKVTDPRIIAVMRRLPREIFLPAAMAARAYADEDVKLGQDRWLMEPMVCARLIQALAPVAGETALVVGAGAGYEASVLAACGVAVVALEQDQALLAIARTALPATAPDASIQEGPLKAGWQTGAPYDIILIAGAVPDVPAALAQQLRPGKGRLACVLRRDGGVGHAALGEMQGGVELSLRVIFDCNTPDLPAFQPAPAFVF